MPSHETGHGRHTSEQTKIEIKYRGHYTYNNGVRDVRVCGVWLVPINGVNSPKHGETYWRQLEGNGREKRYKLAWYGHEGVIIISG